jgi:hypothetical protein
VKARELVGAATADETSEGELGARATRTGVHPL